MSRIPSLFPPTTPGRSHNRNLTASNRTIGGFQTPELSRTYTNLLTSRTDLQEAMDIIQDLIEKHDLNFDLYAFSQHPDADELIMLCCLVLEIGSIHVIFTGDNLESVKQINSAFHQLEFDFQLTHNMIISLPRSPNSFHSAMFMLAELIETRINLLLENDSFAPELVASVKPEITNQRASDAINQKDDISKVMLMVKVGITPEEFGNAIKSDFQQVFSEHNNIIKDLEKKLEDCNNEEATLNERQRILDAQPEHFNDPALCETMINERQAQIENLNMSIDLLIQQYRKLKEKEARQRFETNISQMEQIMAQHRANNSELLKCAEFLRQIKELGPITQDNAASVNALIAQMKSFEEEHRSPTFEQETAHLKEVIEAQEKLLAATKGQKVSDYVKQLKDQIPNKMPKKSRKPRTGKNV